MYFIDTHAHLNFDEFKKDYSQVIKRAIDAGVKKIIVPSSDPYNAKTAFEIAQKFDNVYPAVGAHPLHIKGGFSLQVEDGLPPSLLLESYNGSYSQHCKLSYFEEIAKLDPVVAIGEIGLDYKKAGVSREVQLLALEAIILRTIRLEKPYIFHCRPSSDNSQDALRDLHKLIARHFKAGQKLNGVIHCFAGDYKWAEKFNQYGFLVSYTGLITLTEKYDRDIKKISLENIILETDAPYLLPKGSDNDRCEPEDLLFVAKRISQIKKCNLDKVANITSSRAEELFGI
jgi:TatD DNase family protein